MSNSVWKVGVLFSETGVTAAVEKTQRAATLLAIDEINRRGGVHGRQIQAIAYDPRARPTLFRDYARRLCDEDGVRIIFGCKMSSARKAVLPVVEAREALLFYPTLYEGFEYSQHCIYTGAAPNQNSVQLVNYLATHYGKRVYLIGSNYVFPYESNRVVGELFRLAGGCVAGERYLPLEVGQTDIESALASIDAAKPDVIYSSLVGDGTALFYDAYRRHGFDPATMPIGSLSTNEAEIAQMQPGSAEGHIVAAPYFSTLSTERNADFLAAMARAGGVGMPVTSNAEAAYFQVHLFAKALELSHSDRIEPLLAALYSIDFDAPQGTVRVERENNHTYLWPKVGRVNARGTIDVVFDPGRCVRPDPFMIDLQPQAALLNASVVVH